MSGGKGESDPTMGMILFVIIFCIFGYAIWYFFRSEILEAERWFRAVEIWLVAPFDRRVPDCFTWLITAPVGVPPPKGNYVVPTLESAKAARICFQQQNLLALGNKIEAFEYYNITPQSLSVIGDMITGYLRWPVVVVCSCLAFYMTLFSAKNRFKVKHTLESFIKTQSTMWPVIMPIVNFKPAEFSSRISGSKMPDKMPLFAEAMTPEEWVSWNKIPLRNGVPDKESMRRAFGAQLGPEWVGISNLPPYILALFAAFALKGVQKRDECDELLGKLALCWTHTTGFKMDAKLTAEVTKIAKDPEVGGRALETAAKHAYRTTALLAVLKWARFMGGVTAPAQFLWLRGVDRHLWYSLNNLGRRSFHSEGAGAMAHFMAENIAMKPLKMPRLDTAILSINKYLSDDSRVKVVVPEREGVAKAV